MNGPRAFLVDTNVLVYAHDRSAGPKQRKAIDLLAWLYRRQAGAVSVQVLGEFFWTATRRIPEPLAPDEAQVRIADLARSWTVLDLTQLTVLEALDGVIRHRLPYWDALIWATARMNGPLDVLSEDFSDGSVIEGVRFVNPFTDAFAARVRERRRRYA